MPSKPTIPRECPVCGTRFLAKKADVARGRSVYCSRSCSSKEKCSGFIIHASGSENPNWKGGLTKSTRGYWYVNMPEHPRAGANGYVKRADLVLESKIGRPLLPGEIAHHKNENKEDDSPDNLELQTLASHTRLHHPKQPPKIKIKSDNPCTRRYTWPPDTELVEMHKTLSLRKMHL